MNIAITLSPLCITHTRNIAITHARNIATSRSLLYTINHPIHDRVTAMQYISRNQPHPIMSQDRVILQNTDHPDHLMTNPGHLTRLLKGPLTSPLTSLLTSPLKDPLTSPLTGHLTNHLMSHLTNHPMSHLTNHLMNHLTNHLMSH